MFAALMSVFDLLNTLRKFSAEMKTASVTWFFERSFLLYFIICFNFNFILFNF